MLLANQIAGFFNQSQDLKLAVSHEETNGINWFLVYPSSSFLRSDSLDFSEFWHNGRQFEYWKTDEALFSRKIQFCQNVDKNGPRMSSK